MAKRSEDPQHSLFEAIALIADAGEAKQFLTDLCTPAELEAMAERWRVVEPILNAVPYRKIHDDTHVSVTTVGRVARSITYGSGGYRLIYERSKDVGKRKTANRAPKKGEA